MSKQAQRYQVIGLVHSFQEADKEVTQVCLLPKFMLRTIPLTITTRINTNSSTAGLLALREEVEYGKEMGFRNHYQMHQTTKVSVTPGGTWNTHMQTQPHMHSPVTPFARSVACPAHLDREDICSVSRVHGEQLLMMQWVPHNCMLVIRTRGQQAVISKA